MLNSAGSEPPPKKAQEQQLNRACEACRLSKVRCLVSLTSGSSQCQRCAKAGRSCVFAPPAKRRQRKRTDVRVAELEREVKQMRSLLKPNRTSPVEASDHESMDEDPQGHEIDSVEKESPTNAQSSESNATPVTASHSDKGPDGNFCPPRPRDFSAQVDSLGAQDVDIIDRGLIGMDTAQELLDIYRSDLVQDCPGVVVPSDWSASQLRSKKPALFLAVMAAASHYKGSALSNRLHDEVVHLYAKALFIRGEKSVQYIQALLVTVTYYTPPNMPGNFMIYQYGNMAASMALELGLAMKPRTHEQFPRRAIRQLQRISSAEELLENCRTIIVLYTMTAGFAMRLRRPTILQFNSWMEEALIMLQGSPSINDRRVVACVKLQRIADEANTAFGFDDASTSFSLSELRLKVILRFFERRMQDWKNSVPKDVMVTSLLMEYQQNIISMWEFAMDGGRYDAPEFRNRHLTLPALDDDCIQPESLLSRSALQINATIKCVSAAHNLLDCFLELQVETLRKASNVVFIRALFALVALMKADYAVGTDAEGMGEILISQDLKIDYYIETVIRMVADAVGPQNCRVPAHWLFILKTKLQAWHDEHQQWRKEGKHLKRKRAQADHAEPQATFREVPAEEASSFGKMPIRPSPVVEQTPAQIPTFGMNNPYPHWSSNGMPLANAESNLNMGHQAPFTSDMGAFSAAFQNGDLYLWNDFNDQLGGWIPPGGSLYSDMHLTDNQGV